MTFYEKYVPIHLFFYKHKGYSILRLGCWLKTIGLLFYNNEVYCLNLSIFEAGLNLPDAYIYKKKECMYDVIIVTSIQFCIFIRSFFFWKSTKRVI